MCGANGHPSDRGAGESYSYEIGANERPSEAVVVAVATVAGKRPAPDDRAEVTGRVPGTLEPLYERVDPDALDSLIRWTPDDRADVAVTFTYGEYTVTVRRGVVTVTADR